LKNFDKQYLDLPDYILSCTAQISEARDIKVLDWHYVKDIVVRTPSGIVKENSAIPKPK